MTPTLLFALACGPSEPQTVASTSPPVARSELPSGQGAQAHHLATEGDALRLTWFEPADVGHVLLTAVHGPDGWTEPSAIAASDRFFVNWADTPSVVQGGDGRWVAHYAEKNGAGTYAYDVVLAVSDDGQTWTRLGPAHDDATATEHGFATLWPRPDGVGLVWLDGRNTADGGAMTLRTTTLAEELAPSTELDGRICDCCGTATTLAPDGVPVVAWRDRTEAEVRDIRAVRLDGSEPTAIGEDGWQIAGCPVNGPALATVGDAVLAAWTTGASGALEVRVAVSTDSGRSFGPAQVAAAGDPAPLGRVGLVSIDAGAALTWLHDVGEGRAEVRARRLGLAGHTVSAGPHHVLGTAKAARAAGFPRSVRQGDALLAVWSDPDAGLVQGSAPLDALGAPDGPLPAVGTAAPAELGPDRLPALSGTAPDGSPWTLDARGEPVLVALWASWCAPCRAELPTLADFDDARVVLLAVDDRPEAVAKLAGELEVALIDGATARAAFGTATVPTSFFFDGSGARVWSHVGAVDAAALDPALRSGANAPSRHDSP